MEDYITMVKALGIINQISFELVMRKDGNADEYLNAADTIIKILDAMEASGVVPGI